MKDRLEEFIGQNRNGFDVYDPPEDLWEGHSQAEAGKIIPKSRYWPHRFADSSGGGDFHLGLVAARLCRQQNQADVPDSRLYQIVPELKEAESYYQNQVSLKMKELQPYFRQVPGLDREINQDLTELDSVYVSLKQDLQDNVANDQVIEAMIQNYRMKLEILQQLLDQLKSEQNPNHYETKESVI